jgi:hypothetical protein
MKGIQNVQRQHCIIPFILQIKYKANTLYPQILTKRNSILILLWLHLPLLPPSLPTSEVSKLTKENYTIQNCSSDFQHSVQQGKSLSVCEVNGGKNLL